MTHRGTGRNEIWFFAGFERLSGRQEPVQEQDVQDQVLDELYQDGRRDQRGGHHGLQEGRGQRQGCCEQ